MLDGHATCQNMPEHAGTCQDAQVSWSAPPHAASHMLSNRMVFSFLLVASAEPVEVLVTLRFLLFMRAWTRSMCSARKPPKADICSSFSTKLCETPLSHIPYFRSGPAAAPSSTASPSSNGTISSSLGCTTHTGTSLSPGWRVSCPTSQRLPTSAATSEFVCAPTTSGIVVKGASSTSAPTGRLAPCAEPCEGTASEPSRGGPSGPCGARGSRSRCARTPSGEVVGWPLRGELAGAWRS
mmetsp:Transcript_101899/g.318464  ORF Transcript_101899/g.318464 Transcript_101899/m.318464 type:complete len:239 (-) Transcript_101899:206-922(-)